MYPTQVVIRSLAAVAAAAWFAIPLEAAEPLSEAPRLMLPVISIEQRIAPYQAFCNRRPNACLLQGPEVLQANEVLMQTLADVNRDVNHTFRFALDRDTHGIEDYWALPNSGYGDCEDLALQKRRRLVGLGYPSAALRLALVFHDRHMTSHCILTVETQTGTFVLDTLDDFILRWDRSPYHFESRERPDGLWERFDQSQWWP
jgi:predicted transglutaminase-like cysteine proteinase